MVGQVVEVRLTASVVEIFTKNGRVASHLRNYKKGHHSTDAAHMPDSHRHHLEWTPERIVAWAKNNGTATAEFVDALMKSRTHPEQGFRSALGIMRLAKKYTPLRLEAACARALAVKSFSYRSVESILSHSLDKQPLNQQTLGDDGVNRAHPAHQNIRGPNYYK